MATTQYNSGNYPSTTMSTTYNNSSYSEQWQLPMATTPSSAKTVTTQTAQLKFSQLSHSQWSEWNCMPCGRLKTPVVCKLLYKIGDEDLPCDILQTSCHTTGLCKAYLAKQYQAVNVPWGSLRINKAFLLTT